MDKEQNKKNSDQ